MSKWFSVSKKMKTLGILVTVSALLFATVSPVLAYTIHSITFLWITAYDGTIVMRFNVTANHHWVTSGRLFPLPETGFGTWKFGAINGTNDRYMVVGALMGEYYRICLGASDSDPGSGDILYNHPNNRCFKVWRTGSSTLGWTEIFDIYGRATDNGGNPISDVTISTHTGHTTVTDGNGYYAFRNLDAGSYTLTPSKADYTFSPPSRSVGGGPPFHVTGQDFVGTYNAPTYSISGRVADGSGSPISGVTVATHAGHTTSTDGNGNYTLSGLPAGGYTVTPSKSSYTFLASRYVMVPPNATGQDFVGTYTPDTFSISGRVTDSGGNPISGVTVATHAGHTTSTDGNGNYTLSGLPAGGYTVTPSKSGYTFSASRYVTVPPNATGQDFTATNRYAISGQVTNGSGGAIAGVPLACVSYMPLPRVLKTTITDGNGNYTFGDLAPGFYMIRKTDDSPYTLSPRVRGPLLLSSSRSGQDFTTTPVYGSLIGRVTVQGTGHAIVDARISVGGQVAHTNSSGDYVAGNILPGTHNVYISAGGYVPYNSQVEIRTNASAVRNVALVQIRPEGYRLPYPGGATYKCTQGNDSAFSHTGNSRYAFDFGTAWNAVVASRGGRVIAVKSNGVNCGYWSGGSFICDYNCLYYSANYVKIRHEDNTDSLYLHLSRVDVSVDAQVISGQQIGLSGNTGCSTGAHLHFARYDAGKYQTIPTSFLDVSSNGGVPTYPNWYLSDNYVTALNNAIITAQDTDPPIGSVKFRMTGQLTYTIQLWAADYASDDLQMRLSATEADLPSMQWQALADTMEWSFPEVWVQFKDAANNISTVYSDTLDPIVYEPIQAAFQIPSTICIGQVPEIINQTTPYCEQCGWHWDFGDGNHSYDAEPMLPYPYAGYIAPGPYTITLSVANADSYSSVSHQIQVVQGPASAFTIIRSGASITLTAWETNATSWTWDFGDGTTATGRTVSHTYDTEWLNSHNVPIQLTVIGQNGCTALNTQYVMPLKYIFLPLVQK